MTEDSKGVPVALDVHGQVVEPQDADPHGQYTCLGCGERVNLIAAHQRIMYEKVVNVTVHFSHMVGSQCSMGGEGLQHLATKYRLEQYCQQQVVLRFYIRCPDCERLMVKRLEKRPGEEVTTELTVGNYRLDVAMHNPETGQVRFGIEVLYAHAVDEGKAEGLNLPWFEVPTHQPFRRDREKKEAINVTNTNFFVYSPCTCGNNAFSYREARLRKEEKRRTAEAEEKARRLKERQEELKRLREERAAKLPDFPIPPTIVNLHDVLTPAQEQLRIRLLTDIPDIFQRLLNFTCTLTLCPQCQKEGLFFDGSGMNMMPTWTSLVYRPSSNHPWECHCPACGWHSSRPPAGALYTFKGERFSKKQKQPSNSSFWWNDD